jgi:hypothetical protein
MTIAEKYLAAINQLHAEITTTSVECQAIGQRDDLDDLSTRRYKFADGSTLSESVDPNTYDVYFYAKAGV